MPSFVDDNEDLRWYLDKGIDWDTLIRLTEYGGKAEGAFATNAEAVQFYKEALDMVGRAAAEDVAPRWRELDNAHAKLVDGEVVNHPLLDEIFAKLGALGLHGLSVPRELGGLNAPALVLQIQNELMARADVSVCAHHGFHGGIAMAALMYSVLEGSTKVEQNPPRIVETRFRDVVDGIVSGGEWGSMDITEPDAGSDMARLRCRGVQNADGSWSVTGTKAFITSAHGKWHFVIARTDEGGLDALSMFCVPSWTDTDGKRVRHVFVDKIEDKLGHSASVTCLIRFENAPARLIGARGEGFKYMLLLMNGARVGVGFESLGLCEAAYRAARDYAASRPSMGKTIDRHEMIADMLDEMRTDIQAIRAMCMSAGYHVEVAQKIGLLLKFFPPASAEERERLEAERKRHDRRARKLTPVLKYYASEKAVEMARRAVQIHGGCGYMKDYPVEKLLRDAVVMPIYEGTSQIQALMAMKDTLLAAVRDPRRFVAKTAQARLRSISAGDARERRVHKLILAKQQAVQFLLTRLAASKLSQLRHKGPSDWSAVLRDFDPKRDFALAMLHAERLIVMLADVAAAEELLLQAQKHPERGEVLDRFLERAEPRSRHMYDLITTSGARLLEVLSGAAPVAEAAK